MPRRKAIEKADDGAAPFSQPRAKARAQRWVAWAGRRRVATLDDVPSAERARRSSTHTGVWVVVGAPTSLDFVGGGGEYTVRVSLFDAAARRFYGSTFKGEDRKGSKQHDDALAFVTRVDDGACWLVVEVVAKAENGGELHGVGWTLLQLFGEQSGLRIDASVNDGGAMDEAQLYEGSPRGLLQASAKLGVTRASSSKIALADIAAAAGCRALQGCLLKHRVRRYDALLKCAHLLSEDELVGVGELVPGMGVAEGSARKKQCLAMIGVGRSRVDGTPIANAELSLAKEYTLKVSHVRVKLASRSRLETALLSYVGLQRFSKQAPSGKVVRKKEKIVARRLAVGVHNGRALTMRRSHADGLLRLDLARVDGDVLATSSDAEEALLEYVRHGLYALVAFVEYEVRPLQEVEVYADGSHAPAQTVKVVLGSAAYVPVDSRRRLRLSTRDDPNYVELALENGQPPLEALSKKGFAWPPADGGENIFGSKLVGFELRAFDDEDEELEDTEVGKVDDGSEEDELWMAEKGEEHFHEEERSPRRSSSSSKKKNRRKRFDDDDSASSEAEDTRRRRRRGLDDSLASAMRGESLAEEESRWRSGAPPSSLLASVVAAPIHRENNGRAAPPQRRVASTAILGRTTAGHNNDSTELSRADRSKLSKHGYPTVVLDHNIRREQGGRLDLELESTDPLSRHEVTIQFAAFRAAASSSNKPRAVYFTYQLYALAPTRTESLRLETVVRTDDDTSLLVCDDDHDGRDNNTPPRILKYVVDASTAVHPTNAAFHFAEYLASKALQVDVWDADSRIQVGTCLVPLQRLLRQRSPVAKYAGEHAVVAPTGLVDSTEEQEAGVVGYVQLIMANYGEHGASSPPPEKEQEESKSPSSTSKRSEGLSVRDWRRGVGGVEVNNSEALRASYGGGETKKKKRPTNRVRARPLVEAASPGDIDNLVASRERRGGLFTKAAGSTKKKTRTSDDNTVVCYEEVLTLVRHFRDGAGRVRYEGPLLSLLEAPDVANLEKQLVRVLTKAEAKGTSLERAFAYFDTDGSGTLSLVELEDALRALGCFRGGTKNASAVSLLLNKYDLDGDGLVSLSEFVSQIIRSRQQATDGKKKKKKPSSSKALEARIRALLLRAEELGASVVDCFKEFDEDGSGGLTGVELHGALKSLLGTTSDLMMTQKEVCSFVTARDDDGSGCIELEELMKLMGRDYSDHLQLKLRSVLSAIERRGTRIADAFAAWDSDGGGTLTHAELLRGLESLGVFAEMKSHDVTKLLLQIDADNSGSISIRELYLFCALDYREFLEARLRAVLSVAERKHGIALDAAFREWDSDGGGSISMAELHSGLKKLGVFKGMESKDVDALLRRIDADGSNAISLRELSEFCKVSYTAILARRLRSIILRAEAKGTSLGAIFAGWDADQGGTISRDELAKGLEAMGTFEDMKGDEQASTEVSRLVDLFDADGDGSVSCAELERFMGRDRLLSIEAKLRAVVHSSGISTAEAFQHFDADDSGQVTVAELASGLRELPGFEDVSNADAAALSRLYDADGSGDISCLEFERQVGPKEMGAAEENVLRALRTACSSKSLKDWLSALEKHCSSSTKSNNLRKALNDIDVDSLEPSDLELLLKRFSSSKKLAAWSVRGGVGNPDEIATALGEASAMFTAFSTAEVRNGGLEKFADLLVVFEKSGSTIQAAFSKLDADGAGTLSAKELYAGLKRLGPAFADFELDDAHAVVKALDADNSGEVDVAELTSFLASYRKPTLSAAADKLGELFCAFEDSGGELSAAFRALDVDGSGTIGADEIYSGLKKLGSAFSGVKKRDVEEVVHSMDKSGDGVLDLTELRSIVQAQRKIYRGSSQIVSAPLKKQGPSVEVLVARLRAVLLRAEQSGRSLEKIFEALDDGDGALETAELQAGLERLGLISDTDDFFANNSGDFQAALRAALDADGDGTVSLKELRRFAHEDEEAEDEVIDVISELAEYDFSLDPDARAVEKKLRRCSRSLAARGGQCVRELFEQYDVDGQGSVARSDFVHVLMQLGLSLDDSISEEAVERGEERGEAAALRDRQVSQLRRLRRLDDSPKQKRLQGQLAPSKNELLDDWDELALISWYREVSKREKVRGMLARSMLKTVRIETRFGETAWFEHEIVNPFGRAERITVDIQKKGGLRCVSNAEEWAMLRREVRPALEEEEAGKLERAMIDSSGPQPCVMLMGRERLRIPFCFLNLEPPSKETRYGSNGEEADVFTVQFLASGGYVLAVLEVHVVRMPCVVDRTLRFYQAEGEILRRCVRVIAPRDNNEELHLHATSVSTSNEELALEWRKGGDRDGGDHYEVLVKYSRCGGFPSVGEFYVLLFRDRFCTRVAECWHLVVHSRLKADLHCVAGSFAACELVVRGDSRPRTVQLCGTDSTGDDNLAFDPPGDFRLAPSAHNKCAVRYAPMKAGQAHLHLHLVDVETRELVAAWLVRVTARDPHITKTYDVELQRGRRTTKRIPYRNTWNTARSIHIDSSDPNVVVPRKPRLSIPPNGVDYLRLDFAPQTHAGVKNVLVFLNDVSRGQSEDVFLLRLLVS